MSNTVAVVAPFTMTNVSQAVANLDSTRTAVANVAGKTGEVIGAYGVAMCQAFNLTDKDGNITTPWYDLKGKLSQGVKDERAKFSSAMEAKGFAKPTIDVYWQRVKEASGRVKTVNRVTGGNSVDDMNIRDLKTILNRIDNANDAPLSNKVVALLLQAADQMGIDTKNYAIGQDQE